MRKVIYQTQLTLDGFVAGPNGELDWLVEHALSEDALQAAPVPRCDKACTELRAKPGSVAAHQRF